MSSNDASQAHQPTRSLGTRLTLRLLLGTGLLFLLTGILLDRAVVRWMHADFDRSLVDQAQALVSLTEQTAGVVEFDFTADLMPSFGDGDDEDGEDEGENEDEDLDGDGDGDEDELDQDDLHYFELWLHSGSGAETFSRSPSLGAAHLRRAEDLTRALRYTDVTLPDDTLGRQVQIDFVPQVEAEDEEEDNANLPGQTGLDPTAANPDYTVATLVVARGTEDLADRVAAFRWGLLAGGLLLLTATAGIVRLSIRSALRPLRDVASQVEALDAHRLDQRIGGTPPAELAPLVDKLDDLLARLEEAFERERRFSSDVAHELRTPIAELRSLAEVGGRWPDDRIAVQQFFGDTKQIAEQMEQVVSQLLAVARTEAGIETLEVERFDVAELVHDAIHLHEQAAEAAGIELRAAVDDRVWLDSDPAKIRLVLHNLLANAVNYAPRGTEACVATRLDGDRMVLEVSNPTTDLSDDDLPHLFDRFWRKDAARATPGSSGLGLALVRSLAELLGADLEAKLEAETTGPGDADRPERLFVLRLRFPRGAAGMHPVAAAS